MGAGKSAEEDSGELDRAAWIEAIVVNTRRYALTPIFAAFAISEAVDRPVRFVGRPDTAPVGAFARRIGGLLDHHRPLRQIDPAKVIDGVGVCGQEQRLGVEQGVEDDRGLLRGQVLRQQRRQLAERYSRADRRAHGRRRLTLTSVSFIS